MTIVNFEGDSELRSLFESKIRVPNGLGEITVVLAKGSVKPEARLTGTQKITITATTATNFNDINEKLLTTFNRNSTPDFKTIRNHYKNLYEQKK